MTRAARFTSADLTRAVKAMRKAGEHVVGATIAVDGSITVLTEEGQAANDRRSNKLERYLNG